MSRIQVALLSATLVLCSSGVGYSYFAGHGTRMAVIPPATPQRAVRGRAQSGTELLGIFLVSSVCGASRSPKLPEALRQARSRLAARARSENKRFYFVGVSLDELPEVGLSFLKQYGPFDEVMSGGSWVGTGPAEYLLRSHPGPLALPQLLVMERQIHADRAGITIENERVLSRSLGVAEILDLASSQSDGAPRAVAAP